MSYSITTPVTFTNITPNSLIDFQSNPIKNFIPLPNGQVYQHSTGTTPTSSLAAGTDGTILQTQSGLPAWTPVISATTYDPTNHTRLSYNTSTKRFTNSGTRVYVYAYRTTGFAISGSAFTNFVCDTIQSDLTSSYNTTTGNFTAPSTGIYLVSASLRALGENNTRFIVNGVSISRTNQGSSFYDTYLSSIIYLVAGDVLAYQVSGNGVGTSIIQVGQFSPQFIMITKLH